TLAKFTSPSPMQLPTAIQVSVKERNTIIECELTMRLRFPHIAVRRTPQLFGIFPPHHQDLRSPPSHPAQSFSPGRITLAMNQVSRFNGSKVLEAHIRKLQRQEPM